jgi:N-acetylglutamate synthase-like GNAT family acetyltransferase
VGLGSLTDKGEIRRVYVSPDVQGQNIGHTLMQKLEDAAQMRGYQKVYVDAASSAVGFYEKMGYAVIGNERLVVGDAVFETMKMNKSLVEQAEV